MGEHLSQWLHLVSGDYWDLCYCLASLPGCGVPVGHLVLEESRRWIIGRWRTLGLVWCRKVWPVAMQWNETLIMVNTNEYIYICFMSYDLCWKFISIFKHMQLFHLPFFKSRSLMLYWMLGPFFWIPFSQRLELRAGEISQEEIDDIDLKLSQARTVAFVSLVFCDSWRRIEWLASLVMGLVRFRATGEMMDIDCNCHPVIQCFYVVKYRCLAIIQLHASDLELEHQHLYIEYIFVIIDRHRMDFISSPAWPRKMSAHTSADPSVNPYGWICARILWCKRRWWWRRCLGCAAMICYATRKHGFFLS